MKRTVKMIIAALAGCAAMMAWGLLGGSREVRTNEAPRYEIGIAKSERAAQSALSHHGEPGAGPESVRMAVATAVGVGQVVVFSAALLIALNGRKRF